MPSGSRGIGLDDVRAARTGSGARPAQPPRRPAELGLDRRDVRAERRGSRLGRRRVRGLHRVPQVAEPGLRRRRPPASARRCWVGLRRAEHHVAGLPRQHEVQPVPRLRPPRRPGRPSASSAPASASTRAWVCVGLGAQLVQLGLLPDELPHRPGERRPRAGRAPGTASRPARSASAWAARLHRAGRRTSGRSRRPAVATRGEAPGRDAVERGRPPEGRVGEVPRAAMLPRIYEVNRGNAERPA